MELWACPYCMERITGSLNGVLFLASAHRCRWALDGNHSTVCLVCLISPTGLCAYHTRQKVLQAGMPAGYAESWQEGLAPFGG